MRALLAEAAGRPGPLRPRHGAAPGACARSRWADAGGACWRRRPRRSRPPAERAPDRRRPRRSRVQRSILRLPPELRDPLFRAGVLQSQVAPQLRALELHPSAAPRELRPPPPAAPPTSGAAAARRPPPRPRRRLVGAGRRPSMLAASSSGTGCAPALLIHDLIPVRRPEWRPARVAAVPHLARREPAAVRPAAVHLALHRRRRRRPMPRERGIAARRPRPADPGRHQFGPAPQAGPPPAGLPQPGSYVLFVSTLEARKNHALAVRVWRKLMDEVRAGARAGRERCRMLVFAGRVGSAGRRPAAAARQHAAGSRPHPPDPRPSDAELRALYDGCLFTLLPSWFEGWGLPVSESLALGKPCLAVARPPPCPKPAATCAAISTPRTPPPPTAPSPRCSTTRRDRRLAGPGPRTSSARAPGGRRPARSCAESRRRSRHDDLVRRRGPGPLLPQRQQPHQRHPAPELRDLPRRASRSARDGDPLRPPRRPPARPADRSTGTNSSPSSTTTASPPHHPPEPEARTGRQASRGPVPPPRSGRAAGQTRGRSAAAGGPQAARPRRRDAAPGRSAAWLAFAANLVALPVRRAYAGRRRARRRTRLARRPRSRPPAGPAFETSPSPATPCSSLGAPWIRERYSDIARWLRDERRMRFGVLVHDLVPIRHPEWCHRGVPKSFREWYSDVLPFCDMVLANSRHTAADVEAYARESGIVLNRGPSSRSRSAPASATVRHLDFAAPPAAGAGSYVLFVSTLEARKNHALAVRVWSRLLDEVRAGGAHRGLRAGPGLRRPDRLAGGGSGGAARATPTGWAAGSASSTTRPTPSCARFTPAACSPSSPRCTRAGACRSRRAWRSASPASPRTPPRCPRPAARSAAISTRKASTPPTGRPRRAGRPARARAWEAQVRREFRPVPWTATAQALLQALAQLGIPYRI